MKTVRAVAAVGMALLLGACVPLKVVPTTSLVILNTGYVKGQIRFNPRAGGMMQLPANKGCTQGSGAKAGCIAFGPGQYGTIEFSVVGPGHENKSCGDSGIHWVITRIRISDNGDVDTDKGSDWDSGVSTSVQATIFPFKDASKGIVYEETWETGSTSVMILNRNNNAAGTVVNLWYEVTATECRESHLTSITDPRVENKGL